MEKETCKHCGLDNNNCVCKRKMKWILVLLVIFLAIYLGATHAMRIYSNSTNPRTIVITGQGEVSAIPDISTISFTARASSDTNDTQKLQADIKKSVDEVFAKLKALGIAEKDIQTTNYSVNPKYGSQACPQVRTMIYPSTPCETSKIVGYEASESVNIKVRDTNNTGKVLAILADAKITEVNGPNFEIDNVEKLKDEARDKAIKDAKEKAKSLAKSLGVDIDKIIAFSDNGGQGIYPMMYSKAMDMAASSGAAPETNIAMGEQKITSNVSITFQIED